MLVLTRRSGETLKIGEDVSITILRIKGNQVRLGVNAPRGTSVRRDELPPRAELPVDEDLAPAKTLRTRSGAR